MRGHKGSTRINENFRRRQNSSHWRNINVQSISHERRLCQVKSDLLPSAFLSIKSVSISRVSHRDRFVAMYRGQSWLVAISLPNLVASDANTLLSHDQEHGQLIIFSIRSDFVSCAHPQADTLSPLRFVRLEQNIEIPWVIANKHASLPFWLGNKGRHLYDRNLDLTSLKWSFRQKFGCFKSFKI